MTKNNLGRNMSSKINLTHKEVLVKHPQTGIEIKVDSELVDLLTLIWERDINTVQSCQEVNVNTAWGKKIGSGFAWILFASADDMNKFMAIIAKESFEVQDIVKIGKHFHFKTHLIPEFVRIMLEY